MVEAKRTIHSIIFSFTCS